MRRALVLSVALCAALAACDGSKMEGPCVSPLYGEETPLALPFPSDRFTRYEAASYTGLRIDIPDNVAARDPLFTFMVDSEPQLEQLDGFSVNGEIAIPFSGLIDADTLPEALADSLGDVPVLVYPLDLPDEPGPLMYTQYYDDENGVLYISPELPLHPKTRYGVLVKRLIGAPAADGCVEASEAFKEMISEPSELRENAGMRDAVAHATSNFGVRGDEIALAFSFTTQSIVEGYLGMKSAVEDFTAQAAGGNYDYIEVNSSGDVALRLEGTWYERDFREPGGHMLFDADGMPAPATTAELGYTLVIPHEQPERGWVQPFPVAIVQHGLNNNRGVVPRQARGLARYGIASIGIDAPEHGERASTERDPQLINITEFLAINLYGQGVHFDGLRLRDNWRQAVADHMQLIELIKSLAEQDIYDAAGASPDGQDGVPELDPDNIVYTGISMGGMLGTQTFAVNPEIKAAVLNVAGGELAEIVYSVPGIDAVLRLGEHTEKGGIVRRLVMNLQSFFDPADPASYARYHNLEPLFEETGPRDSLFQMAVDDGTMPNMATFHLVRAAGATLLEPVTKPIPLMAPASIPAGGFAANAAGERTCGLFQFPWVHDQGGADWNDANHGNVWSSEEGTTQAGEFFRSRIDEGIGRIINPYLENEPPSYAKQTQ